MHNFDVSLKFHSYFNDFLIQPKKRNKKWQTSLIRLCQNPLKVLVKKIKAKKFWVQKNIGFKKMLGPKNLGSKKNVGAKKNCLSENIFGQKKNCGSKKIVAKKNLDQKKFCSFDLMLSNLNSPSKVQPITLITSFHLSLMFWN